MFEIARVYLPSPEPLPNERWHLAGIAEGEFSPAKGAVEAIYEALKRAARFEAAASPYLHPGKAARVDAGIVGELHRRPCSTACGARSSSISVLLPEVEERVGTRM